MRSGASEVVTRSARIAPLAQLLRSTRWRRRPARARTSQGESACSTASARALGDDRGRLREGDLAGLHVEHLVECPRACRPRGEAALGVQRLAGLDPARAPEREVHLVAVVPRRLAAHYRLEARQGLRTQRREDARQQPLLGRELGLVRELLEAAAAAARDVRAARSAARGGRYELGLAGRLEGTASRAA
jgi:hypothetical protein